MTYPRTSCLIPTCCSRSWFSSGPICLSHAPVWDISGCLKWHWCLYLSKKTQAVFSSGMCAWHIEYYPWSQKSKQNQNSDVLSFKLLLKYAVVFSMDQMPYSLKIYMEKISIDFSYSSDWIWASPSNINTCVVPGKVHEAAWEIFHTVWWLLCLFVVCLLFWRSISEICSC